LVAHGHEPTNEWTAPSQRFSPFVALCGVGFLGRLSYEMARTPLTPLYAKHLGAPTALIGLIVAAVTITGIVVKLPSGALSDLFGFRRLMMAGALVKATGPFLYLAALSWPALLVVRFYHGLATALYAPPASALVAKVYPAERGQRLGLYNAAENAGVVLGPGARRCRAHRHDDKLLAVIRHLRRHRGRIAADDAPRARRRGHRLAPAQRR
jgi:MFS family permease